MSAVSRSYAGDHVGESTKVQSPDAWKVTLDYLKTYSGVKNWVFKFSSVVTDAISLYDPSYRTVTSFTKDAKNWAEAGSVPGAADELRKRVHAFREKGDSKAFNELVRKTAEFIVPSADFAKAASSRVASLGRALPVIGFVASVSTVISLGYYGINEEWGKIQQANRLCAIAKEEVVDGEYQEEKVFAEAQIHHSSCIIARNAHYTALGAISALAQILKFATPPPLMVALAAGGLFFSIYGHYETEMYFKPELARLKASESNFA